MFAFCCLAFFPSDTNPSRRIGLILCSLKNSHMIFFFNFLYVYLQRDKVSDDGEEKLPEWYENTSSVSETFELRGFDDDNAGICEY